MFLSSLKIISNFLNCILAFWQNILLDIYTGTKNTFQALKQAYIVGLQQNKTILK